MRMGDMLIFNPDDVTAHHSQYLQSLLNRSHARAKMLFDDETLDKAEEARRARRRWRWRVGKSKSFSRDAAENIAHV